MSANLQSYKVAFQEGLSSTKESNMVQAIEDALNAIGDLSKMAWAPGKILALSQLQQSGAGTGQVAAWNGSQWAPATVSGPVVSKKTTLTSVTNTTVKTDLFGGAISIPAGAMTANSRAIVFAGGDYQNNSGSNKTIDVELKLGSQVLWASGPSAGITAGGNFRAWFMHAIIQAQGATNAQQTVGFMGLSDTNAATTGLGQLTAPGTSPTGTPFISPSTNVDMTSSQTLTFSVTHSAAAATVTMRCYIARVEVV